MQSVPAAPTLDAIDQYQQAADVFSYCKENTMVELGSAVLVHDVVS